MSYSNSLEKVRLDIDGPIATVVLSGPISSTLCTQKILRLVDVIEQVRRNNSIRVMVLRGEGRAFCAGDDLAPEDRFKYGPPDLQTRMRTGFPRAVLDMLTLRKPVVGIVQGYAVGAGLDLALACDFRFCDPDAKFGAVYVTRGLGGGSTYLLPRYVGLGRATEMLLLGRFIEMEEAQRLGLVTEVVAKDQLESWAFRTRPQTRQGPYASLRRHQKCTQSGSRTGSREGLRGAGLGECRADVPQRRAGRAARLQGRART